ncbi:hypothetical protein BU251_07690 [Candidatus Velamenicoccus archaeovorus]|uniref:Uncharacterized protein n=1 Tax=Velamenicoccus archaeovorus TaxID=1930593 RepID=A0A410P5Y2_VELA1|nr:hypothetical protein BU251_07690 [Candidatus Velamenicoccus archaeovorus]
MILNFVRTSIVACFLKQINPVFQNSLPAWAGEAQLVDWFCLADKTMAEQDVAPRARPGFA